MNQKDALSGYSLLGKAFIYHRQGKSPNPQTGKCRDACEAQGRCQTFTAGCSAIFTEERRKGLPSIA